MTQPEFDLFLSYAHKDNRGNPGDDLSRIKAVKLAIERAYLEMTGQKVKIFLDEDDIRTGDYWREQILRGLKSSKMLLAFVSDNYFKSEYCRLEWEHYVQTELAQALPGEGIAPLYIIRCPEFEQKKLDQRLRRWASDLERRQVDMQWLDWWPHGQQALEREDVRRRLKTLSGELQRRMGLYAARRNSPTNQMPLLTQHFKGRVRELHELRAHLIKGHLGAITAVNGIPGIGKTELALAYAWGYGGHYPAGRFYLNLAGQFETDQQALETLQQQIAGLAEPKGIPISDVERQTPGAVFRKVVKAFTDHPQEAALFILDNVDDHRLLNPSLLARAIPQGADFDVIITTRHPVANQNNLAWVSVDFLEIDDGVQLLDSFVPISDSPQDVEWKAAYQVAERLGGHAQALNVLAVYMRWRGETSYRKILDYLEREGLSIVSHLGKELEQQRIGLDSNYAERVVERLLVPTIAHLQTEHPAAFRALQLAAFCPPEQIPLPWLVEILQQENPEWGAAGIGGSKAEQAVRLLIAYRLLVPIRKQTAGLVSESTDEQAKVARIHRVYADLIKKESGSESVDRIESTLLGLAIQRSIFVQERWGKSEIVWEIEPLISFADQFKDQHHFLIGVFLDNICGSLRHLGRMSDFRRLVGRMCELMESLARTAPENAVYAWALSNSYNKMGDLYMALGNGNLARRYYEQALEVSERLARADPENAVYTDALGTSYENMGNLFMALGNGNQAHRYYEQSVEIRERLAHAAPENADYAKALGTSYDRMGVLFLALGDGKQALRYYEQALEIRERLVRLAPKNANYARHLCISYIVMGDQFRALGGANQARWYYEQALEVSERLARAAPENADYANALGTSYDRMGVLFLALGDGKQALRYYEQALEIRERLARAAPENAVYTDALGTSYENMGNLFMALGNGNQARRYYEQSLEMRERLAHAAPENAEYARGLSHSYIIMGDRFRALGDANQARRYYEQALEVSERLASADPENAHYAHDCSVSYNKMGDLFLALGDGNQARRCYEQDLEISERLARADSENAGYVSDLSVSYEKMGDLFLALGSGNQTLRYYEQMLKVREWLARKAPENADYASNLSISYHKMGDWYWAQGHENQARRCYEQALEVSERLVRKTPDNPDYAAKLSVSYDRMGGLFRAQGDGNQARHYYEQSLEVRERLALAAPESADYARYLWKSCWQMADFIEAESGFSAARSWWERAYEILSGIEPRGMSISPEDAGFLKQLEEKLKSS